MKFQCARAQQSKWPRGWNSCRMSWIMVIHSQALSTVMESVIVNNGYKRRREPRGLGADTFVVVFDEHTTWRNNNKKLYVTKTATKAMLVYITLVHLNSWTWSEYISIANGWEVKMRNEKNIYQTTSRVLVRHYIVKLYCDSTYDSWLMWIIQPIHTGLSKILLSYYIVLVIYYITNVISM